MAADELSDSAGTEAVELGVVNPAFSASQDELYQVSVY